MSIDIKMPWQSVIDTVGGIISKVVPDRAAAAAANAQLQAMVAAGQLQEDLLQLQAITSAQSDINKTEAASPSVFVAGPRPAVMWVCVAALAYQYLLRPLWTGIALIAAHPIPAPGLPGLDDNLYQLLWALLGLGAMRSFDKIKGVDTKMVSLKGK
jgi:hypothetical protein